MCVFCVLCVVFFIESRESIGTNELHEITHNVKEMQEEKGGASVQVENKNCVGPWNCYLIYIINLLFKIRLLAVFFSYLCFDDDDDEVARLCSLSSCFFIKICFSTTTRSQIVHLVVGRHFRRFHSSDRRTCRPVS